MRTRRFSSPGFTLLLAAILCAGAFGHAALGGLLRPAPLEGPPERIISLAPSITETLYALGLGEQVVGVTEYCAWPPEVAEKPRVAGFAEVNLEAVLRQRPDLVILPADKGTSRASLENLGLRALSVDVLSISGLMESIARIGAVTARQAEAGALAGRLTSAVDAARRRAEGRSRPRVLFSVMRSSQGLGPITEINAIGADGFFSELIRMAGGDNVYQGQLAFPRLSREAILHLNPDVIVDVIPPGENLEAVAAGWNELGPVRAIADRRLVLLTDEAHTVPGPRFADTLARLSAALHPEAGLSPEAD